MRLVSQEKISPGRKFQFCAFSRPREKEGEKIVQMAINFQNWELLLFYSGCYCTDIFGYLLGLLLKESLNVGKTWKSLSVKTIMGYVY